MLDFDPCLENLIVETAESIRPPERLNVWEAAEKYIYVNNPGNYVGEYDADITPYMKEVMETLTSHEFTGIAFVGPAQSGKTDASLMWLCHSAKVDPADMMFVLPTQAAGRDFSKRRVERMFLNSPLVAEALLPGKNNQNVLDVKFKSGMLLTLSWPSASELSGKPIPRLWLSDYDRMPENVDGEGSPFDLAKKRATTFGRFGMTVAESSPGYIVENPKWIARTAHEAPPTKGILALYNRGDKRRWNWQCPQCEEAFEPSFQLLVWPEHEDPMVSAEQAHMACPSCGGVIEHTEKDALNRKGRWIKDGQKWEKDGTISGTALRSEIASFWLRGVAAAFASWKTLVFNYLKAMEEFERTGSQEALKTTVNTDQGDPYVPQGNLATWLPEEMKAKAADLGEKIVPEGVRFLVAAVDVQSRKFVVQVEGIGVGNDTWVVDRFDITRSKRKAEDDDSQFMWLSPGAYEEDWRLLLDEVLTKSYPLSDGSGRRMQVRMTACDSGGQEGVTANAYKFWRWLRDECPLPDYHRRFVLVKGNARPNVPRVQLTYPDSTRKDRKAGARGEVPVLQINSNQIKDQIATMLERRDPGGGKVNFPKWLNDNFYTELTAETRTIKGWENPRRARNESFDLMCYCLAVCLLKVINVEKIDWESPPSWAGDWDENDLVFLPEQEASRFMAPAAKPKRSRAELAEGLA